MHESKLAAAERLASALRGADAGALTDLLATGVEFAALNDSIAGRDAVVARLTEGERYRVLNWDEPQPDGERIRLVGRPASGTQGGGLVLTVFPSAAGIVRIEQQRTPPPPPPASAVCLSPALAARIDSALESKSPMLLAYTDVDGQPVLSFRGSVQTLGDDELGLWIRNPAGRFLQSIAVNPKVALMYRHEPSKATYQFQGRARISDSAADRERVYEKAPRAEREHDFARIGKAVIITLDRVEGYAGLGPGGQIDRILMQRQETRDE
ncbi:MAG: pyridoxamine 5'-phosphate oxidase family protein [Burkholderiaceae bacterium]